MSSVHIYCSFSEYYHNHFKSETHFCKYLIDSKSTRNSFFNCHQTYDGVLTKIQFIHFTNDRSIIQMLYLAKTNICLEGCNKFRGQYYKPIKITNIES